MRFACPSSSSSSLLTGTSKGKPTRRKRIKDREPPKPKLKQTPRIVAFRTVYIGNLIPGTRRHTVAQIFQQFGPIKSTVIRCSSGTVVPVKNLNQYDHHYATVRFQYTVSAMKALSLNGQHMAGVCAKGDCLVVSFSPSDLPEAKKNLRDRLGDEETPTKPQPLVRGDTEEWIGSTSTHRNLLAGISFTKTIF